MALLDTNVLVRHFTGVPRSQARRATTLIARAKELRLVDLVVAETLYVLQSVYAMSRDEVAVLLRAAITYPSVVVDDVDVLHRSLYLFQVERLDFADAYLVAVAESTGVGLIASFDRSLDRVRTVERLEP
jgi:predicted nucleic acid-binding protein